MVPSPYLVWFPLPDSQARIYRSLPFEVFLARRPEFTSGPYPGGPRTVQARDRLDLFRMVTRLISTVSVSTNGRSVETPEPIAPATHPNGLGS